MGLVKVDIHKAEREYESYTISEPDIVKWMLMYRDIHDVTYKTCEFDTSSNDGWNAGNSPNFNQELITMYADLTRLIALCNFNSSQSALIELVGQGFNFEEIAEIKNTNPQTIKQQFSRICNSISEMNNKQWKLYVHKAILKTKTKECTRCGQHLPSNSLFFGKDKRNKDGFKNYCKGCDKK